jgi:hypothetical protein
MNEIEAYKAERQGILQYGSLQANGQPTGAEEQGNLDPVLKLALASYATHSSGARRHNTMVELAQAPETDQTDLRARVEKYGKLMFSLPRKDKEVMWERRLRRGSMKRIGNEVSLRQRTEVRTQRRLYSPTSS